ncbi:PREDICTED: uncharacterized protein LOC109467599 [Branchiostoma belcheri]|uniref:Uncharacterized protein LOC109467599 n=1 Tax=Branchiostoma belcheri TaxID=7741 RepID=A0A6P4YVA4_BRABE|nr:PREDICTED: uncharacterized protein LOC109467599 [Branchiostoma belcheri]
MDLAQRTLKEAMDTRWLSHDEACSSLYKTLPAVLTSLDHEAPASIKLQAAAAADPQAGQPPVPLGGPEKGVVTYPHILVNIPEQFFKQLTGIYFSDEELFRGNYTGGGAHEALNPTILGAILAETNRQYKDEKIKLYRVVTEKCCRVRAAHKARKNKPVALPDANQQQRQAQQDLMISTVVRDALLSL